MGRGREVGDRPGIVWHMMWHLLDGALKAIQQSHREEIDVAVIANSILDAVALSFSAYCQAVAERVLETYAIAVIDLTLTDAGTGNGGGPTA